MNTEFNEKKQLHIELGNKILELTFDISKYEEVGNYASASVAQKQRETLIHRYVEVKKWLYANANDSHL